MKRRYHCIFHYHLPARTPVLTGRSAQPLRHAGETSGPVNEHTDGAEKSGDEVLRRAATRAENAGQEWWCTLRSGAAETGAVHVECGDHLNYAKNFLSTGPAKPNPSSTACKQSVPKLA